MVVLRLNFLLIDFPRIDLVLGPKNQVNVSYQDHFLLNYGEGYLTLNYGHGDDLTRDYGHGDDLTEQLIDYCVFTASVT